MNLLRKIVQRLGAAIPFAVLMRLMTYKVGYPATALAADGEDLIIYNMFRKQKEGLYIDVGAHHPVRFSNTYLLYRKGWHGINIDAMPGSMEPFRTDRPRDINIEAAISSRPSTLTYSMFREPAYNTLSMELAQERIAQGLPLKAQTEIRTRRLDEILAEYLPAGTAIDLLSVDVEGYDLDVLMSGNWSAYKPRVIAIEDADFSVQNPSASAIHNFLTKAGYSLRYMTPKTLIFSC